MRWLWAWLLWGAAVSALSVSLSSPADGSLFVNANVTFAFSTDSNATSCALYTNASGWTSVANASNVSSFNFVFSDGAYLWNIGCSDGNTSFFAPSNRSIKIDTTAPSVPLNLSAVGTTPLNLTWSASNDASSVSYRVFRNGTNVANTSALSFSENVANGTTANYTIQAVDAGGLLSPLSAYFLVNGPLLGVQISNFLVVTSASGAAFSWLNSLPSNATVFYGNATTVFGSVSSAVTASSASLSIAGLLPATNYSYNATACPVIGNCVVLSGSFRTLPSSYPVPSAITVNSSAASSFVTFSANWTDSLNLSSFIFSSNASGAFVNSSPAWFSGLISNYSMVLPSTAMTVAWLFYANNSQGALNQTPVQYLTVLVPAAAVSVVPTPIPTVVPTLAPTSMPTVPPNLVESTPTPSPTVVATFTPTPVPHASAVPVPSVTPVPAFGLMSDPVLDAVGAVFGLSPTGLLIAVSDANATMIFSSNFTSFSDNVTVVLQARLVAVNDNAADDVSNTSAVASNGSDGFNDSASNGSPAWVLSSLPVTMNHNETVLLHTQPRAVPPGVYVVQSQVVLAGSGQVLGSKTLRVQVASSFSGLASENDSPVLLGVWVVLLSIAALFVHQLALLKREFS